MHEVGHLSKGKFVPFTNESSEPSEDESNEESDLDEDDYSIETPKKAKRKIISIFNKKLFDNNQTEGNYVFFSEVF